MPISLDIFNNIWKTYNRCFQIIISPHYHENLGDPSGFGSGFLLSYGGIYYFITADHVTSPHNHPDFVKWGDDCICGIASGLNDEEKHAQLCVVLKSRFEFVKAPKPADENDLVFPEEVDLTFCEAPKEIFDCVTLGFSLPHSLLNYPSNFRKNGFEQADVINVEDVKNATYFVIGTILGVDNTTNDVCVKHKAHLNLEFSRYEDETIVLTTSSLINRNRDWSGLSGSPVVSYDGKLLGMLLMASDGFHEIRVMPINSIVSKINLIQRMERNKLNLVEPFIVVGSNVSIEDVKNNPAMQEIVSKLTMVR